MLWANHDRALLLVFTGQVHRGEEDPPELADVQRPGMEEEEPERVHLELDPFQPARELE